MNVPTPHYVAYLEASRSAESGQWRFSLQTPDGDERFEATDVEPRIRGDRLDLLTVVRALEALDQPSQVTLMGCGPYVRQGIQYGLPDWRDNGWQWEYYGQMVPVKNGDLWQRLARALRFHRVELKQWRIDGPHPRPTGPHPVAPCQGEPSTVGDAEGDTRGVRVEQDNWVRYAGSLLPAVWRHRLDAAFRHCLRIAARAWGVLAARWGDSCSVTPGTAVQLPAQRQVARNVTTGGAERVSA
jgi:ribonuclease HI